jgi:hypothetical protein
MRTIFEDSKQAKKILFIGIALTIISPIIFTMPHGFIDFTHTGDIGDTIGGITSPIVNLVGAILVFYALKAQIKANELIRDQINEQRIENNIKNDTDELSQMYSYLKDSIDSFKYTSYDMDFTDEPIIFVGPEAVYHLFNDIKCDFHEQENELLTSPYATQLISILNIFNLLFSQISMSKSPSKKMYGVLTEHLFKYRIMPALNGRNIEDLRFGECSLCNQKHGMPESIITMITSIKDHIEEQND